jgi:hypothetical protein
MQSKILSCEEFSNIMESATVTKQVDMTSMIVFSVAIASGEHAGECILINTAQSDNHLLITR